MREYLRKGGQDFRKMEIRYFIIRLSDIGEVPVEVYDHELELVVAVSFFFSGIWLHMCKQWKLFWFS